MVKVVLNLNNDKNILDAITSYFKGKSDLSCNEQNIYDIDALINTTNDLETAFTNDFSKCVCDDKMEWVVAVCYLNQNSADLEKIKELYFNLKKTYGNKVYLLTVFDDRCTAGKLAWENEIQNIDVQVLPKKGGWGILFSNICKSIENEDKKIYLESRYVVLFGFKKYAGSSFVEFNAVCDSAYSESISLNNKDLPIISIDSITKIEKAFVIIGFVEEKHKNLAIHLLKSKGIEYDFLENYVVKSTMIYLDYLVNSSMACYRDVWGNKFVYAGNYPYKMAINIQPFSLERRMNNNRVYIGKNFECSIPENSYLRLRSPENSVVIEDNVKIISGEIIVSGAQKVLIKENTLIARNAILRCEISHPLFDAVTKELLGGGKKDIVVGNHVWMGEECYLLSGARIGDGSVMGARSLTSSTIEANSLAIGAPAKVIRKNILWAKDNYDLDKKHTIYDCIDQEGLKYYEHNTEEDYE